MMLAHQNCIFIDERYMPKQLTIKNQLRESRLFKRRCLIISIIVALAVLSLVARLFYLQILQHRRYATLSQKNLMTILPIPPARGLIYDRNGVLLAENIPAFSLTVIPNKVSNLKKEINALKKIVSLSDDDISDFYKSLKRYRPYQPVPLKFKLSEDETAKFYVNQYRFPGFNIIARLIRQYPLGKYLSSVVGHVGRITKSDLQNIDAINYSATDYIGKTGIEKYYEKQLHGTVGTQEVETDAAGKIVRAIKRTPPISGDNLYLTIDSNLQKAAMDALGDEAGAVVAIEPATGEVLALVTNPSYDPNQFITGFTGDAYQQLLNAPGDPLYNRAVQGQFAPGSTIKPFMAIEGLDSGIITTDDTIYDPGYFQLKGTKHIYHDWDPHGHGWVNVTKAITVSSDTFFYNLAVAMGINRIDDILNQFGFGKLTYIDTTDENSGLVPSRAWKGKYKGESWYIGDTIITGIGQGFLLATPLQLAQAVAIIADRGIRIQPHLLLKQQPFSQPAILTQKVFEPPVILNHPSIWNVVIQAMQDVIRSPDGTGWRFGRNTPYTVAGKTGTAQVYSQYRSEDESDLNIPKKLRNNMLFICFAPIDRPKIALAVITEHSDMAPIVARKVMDAYLLQRTSNQSFTLNQIGI